MDFDHSESRFVVALIAEQGNGSLQFGVLGHAVQYFFYGGKMYIREFEPHLLAGLQSFILHVSRPLYFDTGCYGEGDIARSVPCFF